MNKTTLAMKLYEELFHSDTPISALKAWDLIETAMADTHNNALSLAVSAAINWTNEKERDDYDTFSAASAIIGAIHELKVSQ